MPKEKAKKSKEPKISYFQAITTFKINNVEKQIREFNEDLDKLVEKNFNLKQRNERLNQTKENNIKKALDDYKKFTNDVNSKKKCERDEVLDEMKELWKFKQNLDKELTGIKKEIRKTEKEINNFRREYKLWEDFKNHGTRNLEIQIRLLKKELNDMNENYEIISNNLRNNTVSTIDQIKKNTEEIILKKNKVVAEKCFKFMDKDSIEMSRENIWMKEKIETYKHELKDLQDYTSNLEQENIQLMSYLFECNNQEVKYIKNVFANQFLDNENLEENMIMNVDLDQLDSVRPNSALDLTIKKLKQIELRSIQSDEDRQLLAIENTDDNEDEEQLTSRSKIVPKNLYLNGLKKPLIKLATPSEEEIKADKFNGNDWPITQEMLSNALNQK